MAKQNQVKMQTQVGALAAIPQLENRTDEQLQSESKHRVAAKAILGARAAERYDVEAFIICRSAGRSCGWQPARASLKYLRAASTS